MEGYFYWEKLSKLEIKSMSFWNLYVLYFTGGEYILIKLQKGGGLD